MYGKQVFLACVLALTGIAGCGFNAGDTSDSELEEFSRRTTFGQNGGLAKNKLVLTFDDGPGRDTLKIAEYLYSQGIKATFFVLAPAAKAQPRTMQKLKEMGHVVANHTVNHQAMSRLSRNQRIYEVRQNHRAIESYLTDGIQVFRAPYGDWAASVANQLNSQADLRDYVGPVFWDIGGGANSATYPYDADWACEQRGTSAAKCADRYYRESVRRKGGIVLFHDVRAIALPMVRNLVPRWKSAGFTFARIDDVPSIKAALKKTSTYSTEQCKDKPDLSFDSHGQVFGVVDVSSKKQLAKAVVDTKTPRKFGLAAKVFIKWESGQSSNFAFDVSPANRVTGVQYNMKNNQDQDIQLTWTCDGFVGRLYHKGAPLQVKISD